MPARAKWKLPEPDPRPGQYYCTARYGDRTAFLSGPFATHPEALADLERAKGLALNSGDPKAHFAAFGTSHVEGSNQPRVFFPKA